jgi:predicted ATPase
MPRPSIAKKVKVLKPVDKNTTKNAIDYIRDSSICTDDRYSWLRPLIEGVLKGELEDEEISRAVLGDSAKPIKEIEIDEDFTETVEEEEGRHDIQSITSIEKIENIGLVDITEQIKIDRHLNIFYGKNGSGKSSIYLGLCSLFGKEDKIVIPNLDKADEQSTCLIKYKDSSGTEKTLEWDTDTENVDAPVMIFDGNISQSLVEQDQANQFEIAHLKLEYFSLIREMSSKVEVCLNHAEEIKNRDVEKSGAVLESATPFIFGYGYDINRVMSDHSFSEQDKVKLKGLEEQIILLGKNTPEATIKNLRTAKGMIDNAVSIFYKFNSEKPELRYTQKFIDDLNSRIKNYKKAKKDLEEGGQNKIAKLIPSGWISEDTWTEFIQASLAFVGTLDKESKEKYQTESCLYCQQPLKTPESKKLIETYAEIMAEHDSKLKEEEAKLKDIAEKIKNHNLELDKLVEQNKVIEAEFPLIQKTGAIPVDIAKLRRAIGVIVLSLKSLSEIPVSSTSIKELKEAAEEYTILQSLFETKINELEKAIEDKQKSIKEWNDKAEPLRQSQKIEANKKTIKSYLEDKKELKKTEDKKNDIYMLKQRISSLESEFSKVAGLKEFKDCLDKEYKELQFIPPSCWSIEPTTRGGVNKRVYSLSDKRLGDIFSEGERKLHSLADFFAQCEVNKYKGIYIFDDPVNSLDEDNIQHVADRICKLAGDGNQVIVFTHNLYFLNAMNGKKIYKLDKIKGQIIIEKTDIDDTSDLKTRMKTITDKMTELDGVTNPTREQMGIIYDLMSGYLESYVEKILFKGVVSRYRANLRMTSLESLDGIPAEKISAITTIYNRTSRMGTRHSQPAEIPSPRIETLKSDYETLKTDFNWVSNSC